MRHQELQAAARRQPFEPFRLILTTGATYDIRHPDLFMVGLHSAIIGIARAPDDTVYHRTVKVDLLHVVGVEELPPTSAKGPAS
jgi:hypothetical protein